MARQIKLGIEARQELVQGIDTLADAVIATLGPNGRNAIIDNGNIVQSTKDGVTVAKSINLSDPIQNVGVKLIKQAAIAGAHAAKFQTYKAETLASKNSPAYWDQSKEKTNSQYALFKKYDKFGDSEYTELAEYCLKFGIDFLSTPFDLDAVDALSNLVPAFKIASADITNIPLIIDRIY